MLISYCDVRFFQQMIISYWNVRKSFNKCLHSIVLVVPVKTSLTPTTNTGSGFSSTCVPRIISFYLNRYTFITMHTVLILICKVCFTPISFNTIYRMRILTRHYGINYMDQCITQYSTYFKIQQTVYWIHECLVNVPRQYVYI